MSTIPSTSSSVHGSGPYKIGNTTAQRGAILHMLPLPYMSPPSLHAYSYTYKMQVMVSVQASSLILLSMSRALPSSSTVACASLVVPGLLGRSLKDFSLRQKLTRLVLDSSRCASHLFLSQYLKRTCQRDSQCRTSNICSSSIAHGLEISFKCCHGSVSA